MAHTIGRLLVTWVLGSAALLLPFHLQASEQSDVKTHAERSFDRLTQQQHAQGSAASESRTQPETGEDRGVYSPDRYWIGKGQGDLTKGKVVCQRVSELSARTDLAKQIRVMVKEHLVDRVRERTGRESEQDIELTREELVQEYLLGVKIVDRGIDEDNKICTATAVMLRSPMQPKQAARPDSPAPSSP